jgi:hypothetical protein
LSVGANFASTLSTIHPADYLKGIFARAREHGFGLVAVSVINALCAEFVRACLQVMRTMTSATTTSFLASEIVKLNFQIPGTRDRLLTPAYLSPTMTLNLAFLIALLQR